MDCLFQKGKWDVYSSFKVAVSFGGDWDNKGGPPVEQNCNTIVNKCEICEQ